MSLATLTDDSAACVACGTDQHGNIGACTACAAAWTEYDMLAEDCARRGVSGKYDTQFPALPSIRVLRLIDADRDAFMERVRGAAYARACASRDALTTCNACDAAPMVDWHPGGYCAECAAESVPVDPVCEHCEHPAHGGYTCAAEPWCRCDKGERPDTDDTCDDCGRSADDHDLRTFSDACQQGRDCDSPECLGLIGGDGLCSKCGVDHSGEPCPTCTRTGYHRDDCTQDNHGMHAECGPRCPRCILAAAFNEPTAPNHPDRAAREYRAAVATVRHILAVRWPSVPEARDEWFARCQEWRAEAQRLADALMAAGYAPSYFEQVTA